MEGGVPRLLWALVLGSPAVRKYALHELYDSIFHHQPVRGNGACGAVPGSTGR
jgi:hypothetical protein